MSLEEFEMRETYKSICYSRLGRSTATGYEDVSASEHFYRVEREVDTGKEPIVGPGCRRHVVA